MGAENKSVLTVDVRLKDTDLFNDVLEILKEVLLDNEIPREIREKYLGKAIGITARANLELEG